jgi:hypothetical protein
MSGTDRVDSPDRASGQLRILLLENISLEAVAYLKEQGFHVRLSSLESVIHPYVRQEELSFF